MQDLGYELPRIPIPRTPVNRGTTFESFGYRKQISYKSRDLEGLKKGGADER
jgi:hypothetical protein